MSLRQSLGIKETAQDVFKKWNAGNTDVHSIFKQGFKAALCRALESIHARCPHVGSDALIWEKGYKSGMRHHRELIGKP